MSAGHPLQIVADPRFHWILFRAKRQCRVVPGISKDDLRSDRSSFSSASIVSTIDLRSPEPEIQNVQTTEKLINREIRFGLVISAIILLIIGIILTITLPIVLIKHSSEYNTINLNSSTVSS